MKTMPELQAADEKQLLGEAKRGNAEAFGELYERHAPDIFRFLYGHMDDRLDAEDLTEEVFLKAWRALPKYREKGYPFSAFLYRIAHNTLIDYYRTSARPKQDVQLESSLLRDPCPEPGDYVSRQIEHQELHQTLHKLKEDYRMVLIARYISNLSPEETGKVMGKSPGAVRVLQFRALAALRKLIEK